MGERKAWADKRAEIMSRPGAGAAYEAARIRFELGEAVRPPRRAVPPTARPGREAPAPNG